MARTSSVDSVDRANGVAQRRYLDDALNVVLLALVVLPPAVAIEMVRLDPVLPFNLVLWSSVAGLLLGVTLAGTGRPGQYLHPLAIVGGGMGVLYAVAQVVPRVPADASIFDRLEEIQLELTNWTTVVAGGGQATNNYLFLLLLCVIGFVVGYFSSWAVFRENSAWWPVTTRLPAGATLSSWPPARSARSPVQPVACRPARTRA